MKKKIIIIGIVGFTIVFMVLVTMYQLLHNPMRCDQINYEFINSEINESLIHLDSNGIVKINGKSFDFSEDTSSFLQNFAMGDRVFKKSDTNTLYLLKGNDVVEFQIFFDCD